MSPYLRGWFCKPTPANWAPLSLRCLQVYSAASWAYSLTVGSGLKTIGGSEEYTSAGSDVEHMHGMFRRASSLMNVTGAAPAGSPSITANGLMSLAILIASARDASSLVGGPDAVTSWSTTWRP